MKVVRTMSQPAVSEAHSPSLRSSNDQHRASARHAPYGMVTAAFSNTSPSSSSISRFRGGGVGGAERSSLDAAQSTTTKAVPRSSTSKPDLSPRLHRSTSAGLSHLTLGSPSHKSFAIPVVARKHVLSSPTQSYSSFDNARQSSSQLLASAADEDRRARRSSTESCSSVSSSQPSLLSSSRLGENDDALSSVSSFEQVSTVPTPFSQSVTKVPRQATPPVAVQPPVGPHSYVPKTTENSQACPVATEPGVSHEPSIQSTAAAEYLPQHIPTIEQRDALAARVYGACRAAGYEEWLQLLDLAPLASQHHLSGYNCIKFGQEGSPYAYLPLTLQQPEQAHELREKQKINETRALAWLAEKRKAQRQRSSSPSNLARKAPRLDLDDTEMQASVTEGRSKPCKCRQDADAEESTNVCSCGPLTNEAVLSAEWEAPLDAVPNKEAQDSPQALLGTSVKTSTTHPISISPIIPPELLRDVSEYVRNGTPQTLANDERAKLANGVQPPKLFDSQTSDEQHHQLQLDGKRLIRCRVTCVDLSEIALKAEQELIAATHAQMKPRSLSLHSPLAVDLPVDVLRQAVVVNRRDSSLIAALATDRRLYCETRCDPYPANPEAEIVKGDDGNAYLIGNLLLSSCPGKKVRLTGPVRGRGAICRDLGLDLRRIRQLGVSAIICCLDDEELKFLGASWSQYEREADKLGIEVVRLPMAEGFCPTDVIATDKAISCVVNDYTLRGVPVLVHCRGGVGRAGLIACMWLLKLGLVRSDVDEMRSRLPFEALAEIEGRTTDQLSNTDPSFPSTDIHSDRDTMQTIHRLIETIRRRRSPKAIETAEQVCFLVKYLTYLKNQERKHLRHVASTLCGT